MTTTGNREVEIEYFDLVKHDSRSGNKRSGADNGSEGDGWRAGFRQLIKEYIMNEPDVARVSSESEAYVLIEETTNEDVQTENQVVEEVTISKVTSEESSVSWPTETEPKVNGEVAEEKPERKRITTSISLTQEEMESDKENDPTQSPSRGGSKRLDLAMYQPMGGDSENKRSSVTKRLDTARFSKFQGDSTDSVTPIKVTRNFAISPAARKFNSEKQPAVATPDSDRCVVCKKTVYSMEKITADGISYHKTCFRCRECNRCLSLGNFAQSKQFLYCKPHFAQLFRLKGNYDDGFDGSSRSMRISATPDSENGIDQNDGQQASEEDAQQFEGAKSIMDQFEKGPVSNVMVKKSFDHETITKTNESLGQTTSETEPVLRPDVVRSSDIVDDRVMIAGMRSLRDQFEKGEGAQSSSGKSFDFQEEIRAARGSEVQVSIGQVAESTPVRNEDVVRSDVKADEVKTFSGGIRSLKDRFEKGAVSNIDTTPVKPVIEVRSLEDYNPDDVESGVSESTPVVRDDVIRSSQKMDDPFFKSGGARSLKARFEQGNVSNIEEKPKEKIEISPGSLENYREEQDVVDQGGVSENTPLQRDDVLKEGKGEDDPRIKRGAARNLRSLFEKGEVHNIEEKPRATLERSPKSLDQLDPPTEGVVENTPEVRTDLVRETSIRDEPMNIQSGVSRSLKDRWEKGEVDTAPEKPKEVIDIKAELRGQGQVAESNPEVREDLVRESSENPEETAAGASSLRAQWEAGDIVHAENRVQKEELSPKRLSSYYDGEEKMEEASEDIMEQVVEAESKKEVEPEEEEGPEEEELEAVNRHQEEDENEQVPNGHTEENGFEIEVAYASPENEEAEPVADPLVEFETTPGQDIASWEIKAARAAALQSQDGDEDVNEYANEYANEGTPLEGDDSGLLIDIGDGDISVGVTIGNDDLSHD